MKKNADEIWDNVSLYNNTELGCAFAYYLSCDIVRRFKLFRRYKSTSDFDVLSMFKRSFRSASKKIYEDNKETLMEKNGVEILYSLYAAFEDFGSNTLYFTKKYYVKNGRFPSYEEFRAHWGGSVAEKAKYNIEDFAEE